MKKLKSKIRDIPDFPVKGVLFRDITTLLKDIDAFDESIERMAEIIKEKKVDKIIGIEARGFIFAAPIAYKLKVPLNLIRKPGKLPAETVSESYKLEYGENTVEIHKDAITKGDKVVICDDLLATGGTAKASAQLVTRLGGEVVSILFLIELTDLKGRDKLKDYAVDSILKY
ncbi:adenine phosphoribosyltransferase [candidate division WOR-3 bacterium]|jgi:adenine phosphoribosyltransferase|nr:adenine phosphoribosyltransferase [candidate division WOR-3 bacterium]